MRPSDCYFTKYMYVRFLAVRKYNPVIEISRSARMNEIKRIFDTSHSIGFGGRSHSSRSIFGHLDFFISYYSIFWVGKNRSDTSRCLFTKKSIKLRARNYELKRIIFRMSKVFTLAGRIFKLEKCCDRL